MSISSIHGTLSAQPYGNTLSAPPCDCDDHGTLSAPANGARSGTLSAPISQNGSLSAPAAEAPEDSTVAELSGLISSLNTLSSQAQSLPLTLSAPTLPGLPQQNYQPQATDYTQLAGDTNS